MSTLMLYSLRVTYSNCKALSSRSVFFSSYPEQANQSINKVINVAIIGAPNSGKSTLINNILERKICAASNKVHTTTKLVRAMCFQNNTQIIFLDTPGVATEKEQKKYKLPESMLNACYKSLRCADVIGVVHDISNKWTKDCLHFDVVGMLNSVENVPSFLIINKIDRLESKRQLLSVIRNLTNGMVAGNPVQDPGMEPKKRRKEKGYGHFSDIFLVSALNGDGVQDIKNYLISNAKPASLHYSPDEWTDQTPESLIAEAVRAKFMDFLAQELPYSLKTELEYYEDSKEKIVCSVSVECPSERIARLISGAGGGRLQQIKSQTRNDLIDLFKKPVAITIQLKVRVKSEVK